MIVFGFLGFCICLFMAWYFAHEARHKERMLMIEKGMDPDAHAVPKGSALLKFGIVVIGLSLGVVLIGTLAHFDALVDPDAIPLGILGLSGGISLLIANRVSKS
jgi:hypothetical protein